MSSLFTALLAPNGRRWTQPLGLFINNTFIESSTGQKITCVDPATGREIAAVEAAGPSDVDKAVRAAHDAMKEPSWKLLPASGRGTLLAKLADLLENKRDLFATIDAWDNGKPYAAALGGDLPEAVSVFRYYSGWADKIFGQTIPTTPLKFAYTLRQPIGVVAQIIPWNYPLCMAAWKLGPALASGCAVVLKPAEQTPLSALVLGALIREAGFPPGVVNIINGAGPDVGDKLVRHPLVRKVAFTGSTTTASAVMAAAAADCKPVTVESGGKSPLLVFSDADLGQAVTWSHFGIMSNQGQICTATSRILVQDAVYDEFVTMFVSKTKQVSLVGNQWDQNTFQGPQVSQQQYDKILEYIEIGKREGATLSLGGHPARGAEGKEGFFIAPTVFTEVTDSMRISREEIFGPVVTISRFSTEHEAVARANDSTYGLGASVFTRDLERAHRIAVELEAGMVWINSSQDCDTRIPFGGVKRSGIGRELGEAGLDAYTQIKAVHVNLGTRSP